MPSHDSNEAFCLTALTLSLSPDEELAYLFTSHPWRLTLEHL